MAELWEVLDDIRDGITKMQQEASRYEDSKTLFDFTNQKERDYIDFKDLVCRLGPKAFMPDVISYIQVNIRNPRSRRYYGKTRLLGIASRGGEYFQLTAKLKKQLKEKQTVATKVSTAKNTPNVDKKAPIPGQMKMGDNI